ncbi:hypothetical protein BKA67DRAFT_654641 [Truncatella angustata]|uniref:Protein kinase domain-containing protein n=1 Tax=Truncatella angustata TaxID=152316 RepID=A0A9P8UQF3_9PEZI|nr:uncharacterized protein BKA67DRAFT_654641 [Truncatella angustata]KAH6656296.1 hypothetical protein BKA67DRAFT_654641 [Truncatella angustata]
MSMIANAATVANRYFTHDSPYIFECDVGAVLAGALKFSEHVIDMTNVADDRFTGTPWVIMDFLLGGNLGNLWRRSRPEGLPIPNRVLYSMFLCRRQQGADVELVYASDDGPVETYASRGTSNSRRYVSVADAELIDAVCWCLTVDPANRPSLEELVAVLENLVYKPDEQHYIGRLNEQVEQDGYIRHLIWQSWLDAVAG